MTSDTPNMDYPADRERIARMELQITTIGDKVDALAHGAEGIVEELKAGNVRMAGIETDVKLIRQKLDDHPDGLTAKVDRHEVEIRDLRDVKNQRSGAREWWKAVTLLIVGALVSLAVTFGTQAVKRQEQRVDVLCTTKFQSLDTSRARGAISQRQYERQMKTLVAQGCTR